MAFPVVFGTPMFGVSQSCAAEVRNTLPAAFTLAEVVTDPGFYLIKASYTWDEYDC